MDYFIVDRASKSAPAAIKTGMQPFAALLNISDLVPFAAFCSLPQSENAAFCSLSFSLRKLERRKSSW